ncbi:unnamed protein product [Strongylus vulgaris]|uniref:Uncharacterized protein n=1 Tax=Strongylus vulgaris TaxID=40348 RepID=A0A3P7LL83_STRVU|nr:unnamed protein product [Strongylus vulgaris]
MGLTSRGNRHTAAMIDRFFGAYPVPDKKAKKVAETLDLRSWTLAENRIFTSRRPVRR